MSRNRKIPIATALIVNNDSDDMMGINYNNNDVNNNNYSDDQNRIAATTRDNLTSSFYSNNNNDNNNDSDNNKFSPTKITNQPNINSLSLLNSNNYTQQLVDSTTTIRATISTTTTSSEPATTSSTSTTTTTRNKMYSKLKKSSSQISSTPKYSFSPTNIKVTITAVTEGRGISTCPYPKRIFNYHNEEKAREFLSSNKVPNGIQEQFIRTLKEVPMRYFILDDSGSMCINDGRRVLNGSLGRKRIIPCSRWTELVESMKFHINFARFAVAPSEFRLINMTKAYPIGFGFGDDSDDDKVDKENYDKLMIALNRSVSGKTPLCKHINEVAMLISKTKKELIRNGQKVCVVIATDGEATDGNLTQSMKQLIDLPVWIVIRLCTNEAGIVEYWNRIDEELELNIDVIDDYTGEAVNIKRFNSWLTYGESLHRLREFGYPMLQELDHIDERRLSAQEFIKICHLIFGGELSDYPHPQENINELLNVLHNCNEVTGKVWDPMTGSEQHWINIRKVASKYGHQRRCIVM